MVDMLSILRHPRMLNRIMRLGLGGAMLVATCGTGAFGGTLLTCVDALPSGGLTRNICLGEMAVGAGVKDSLAIFIL